ncbi:MAG: PTS sugar transporter subunit IIB [Streptococcaceae bacterium]|nr:PTS sugar transporter subunit IIB [Streptococcaceae bacterium]
MSKGTVLLICAAGMSTSLLVTKMQRVVERENRNLEVVAASVSEMDEAIQNYDVKILLLGPQVRFLEEKYKEILNPKGIPVSIVSMRDFGMMDGEAVMHSAIEVMEGGE